jgi:hypothetical protein
MNNREVLIEVDQNFNNSSEKLLKPGQKPGQKPKLKKITEQIPQSEPQFLSEVTVPK